MKNLITLIFASCLFFGCAKKKKIIIPSSPINLTASVASSTQVNLSWTDNASNEDGYKMERKTGTGNYTVINNSVANSTTYSDASVIVNNTYTYRVYAFNSAGNSSYSNEVTVDIAPTTLNAGLTAK